MSRMVKVPRVIIMLVLILLAILQHNRPLLLNSLEVSCPKLIRQVLPYILARSPLLSTSRKTKAERSAYHTNSLLRITTNNFKVFKWHRMLRKPPVQQMDIMANSSTILLCQRKLPACPTSPPMFINLTLVVLCQFKTAIRALPLLPRQ